MMLELFLPSLPFPPIALKSLLCQGFAKTRVFVLVFSSFHCDTKK